jgi:hypothetical protein
MRNVTNPSLAHLLPISFVNLLLNPWDHMLALCGPTYSMVDLLISCIEMNTKCAKDGNQTFLLANIWYMMIVVYCLLYIVFVKS